MGWTASDDMLDQVELSFPTLDAAVTYAERQGVRYSVDGADDPAGATVTQRAQSRAECCFPYILSAHLATAWLEMRYGAVPAADELQPGQEQKSESEGMIIAVCPAPGARSAASG